MWEILQERERSLRDLHRVSRHQVNPHPEKMDHREGARGVMDPQ
jgi:hypothetical protein